MTARELRAQGELYKLDDDLRQSHVRSMCLTRQLGEIPDSDFDGRRALVQELFGHAGKGSYIRPPFYCDFGENISVGERFYCNCGCVFTDVGKITIGDDVMLGPMVGLYSATHPIDPIVRATHMDIGKPITIGNNVWIGGSSVVCPGVTIGNNVVIGAGSVVVKDIPDNVVAVGNPCHVVRQITEEDTKYWNEKLNSYRMLCDDPMV